MASSKIYSVREKICEFIGGKEPESIVFTNNATMSLNLALKGVMHEKNNHIITTYTEHNSILRQIYSHENITCSFLTSDADYVVDVSKIPKYINENTNLIVLNCASNVTGCVANWKDACKIAEAFRIPILLDFSQAIGNVSVNLGKFSNQFGDFFVRQSLSVSNPISHSLRSNHILFLSFIC